MLDGILFARMVNSGAANLKAHVKEINDLNVFPIPDGDTGDNMLLTMMGGVQCCDAAIEDLGEMSKRISNAMLLSARGNSGVILSQFFEGIKNGFSGIRSADMKVLEEAFCLGAKHAYGAVMTPTEGTMLTVVREASEYACAMNAETLQSFLEAFIDEAKRSLDRTPELLPILKKAGVVDSGAAGLIYIIDGMLCAVLGRDVVDASAYSDESINIDVDAFDENSVLEFGYCTELLVRLLNSKTDISAFDEKIISDYLQSIGDSIVVARNGSIIKLHVHTTTPHKVLEFCQKYGEFLRVKIENMSLQHNNTIRVKKENETVKERKKYAVVAVACGEGLKQIFLDRGADYVVDGGQSMNPSADDFINAFDEVNADVIFVYPNNGNIILAARQAAQLYNDSDVRVIESTTIGSGYASLSMLDTGLENADAIQEELRAAMEGVVTIEFSRCVRNATIDDVEMRMGDYIGFVGKKLLSVNKNRLKSVCESIDKIGMDQYDVCIVLVGKSVVDDEARRIEEYIGSKYVGKEVYITNGDQEVYDYIIILE